MMELEIELKKASDSLKSWDTTSISLTAGCDLFMRYVTRTSALEYEEFNSAKSRLIERADKFGEISYKAQKIIAMLSQDFIFDGCTILVHGFSRVVFQVLKLAAQNNKLFRVFCTDFCPPSLIIHIHALTYGRIHRDVKAGNILLNTNSEVNKCRGWSPLEVQCLAATSSLPFYLQDKDFVADKDDGGSPTDDSGAEDSDASESGDEKEKPTKKESKKDLSSKASTSKKKSKDADKEGKKKKQKKKKDPNAPKRAMSGFMFFSQMERENLKKSNPGIHLRMWEEYLERNEKRCQVWLIAKLFAGWGEQFQI